MPDLAQECDLLLPGDLRGRKTAKWSYYGDDVLPAWVAEMDFPTAPVIRQALAQAIQEGLTGYPPGPESSRLPTACADWLQRSFGVAVTPAQIGVVPDILRGLELAIQLFSRSESPVVVPTPAYPPFFEVVHTVGRASLEVPMLTEGDRAGFDLDGIEDALRAGAGTVILCNPNNPLGRVFGRDELTTLSEVVERHGARVVADEVHAPLVYPGSTHVSYSTVSDAAARHSVTLTSASKGWNVPGLKCAQIVLTNPRDVEIWSRVSFVRTHGAGILGILANTIAYEEGGPWLKEIVAYLDGNRRLLGDLLTRHLPAIRYTMPEGTYLAWLDCRDLGLDDPVTFFHEEAKVALMGGVAFGPPGVGFVRLNFATSRAILTEIVERMAAAMDRVSSS